MCECVCEIVVAQALAEKTGAGWLQMVDDGCRIVQLSVARWFDDRDRHGCVLTAAAGSYQQNSRAATPIVSLFHVMTCIEAIRGHMNVQHFGRCALSQRHFALVGAFAFGPWNHVSGTDAREP